MTPVQVAAEIKRLDKEISKADEGIHASRALYEPDLSAHRAGWHRSVWSAHATDSAVFHTHVMDRSRLCGKTAPADRVQTAHRIGCRLNSTRSATGPER
jgi:hypothetical protein